MEISFSEFTSYKHSNKDILPDLVEFINIVSTDPRYKKSKMSGGREPNNWLTSKRFHQNESDRVMADIKSILNKLTESNFDVLSEQVIGLNITKTEHLKILIEIIIEKAKMESKFSNIYAQLSKKMAQYFTEEDGERIFLKDLLIDIINNMFESSISLEVELDGNSDNKYFNYKEEVTGFITFIGELYNYNMIDDTTMNSHFRSIFMKTMFKKNPYIIDILCKLIDTVNKTLKENSPPNFKECVEMMSGIVQNPNITNKEKYMIMDSLDTIKNL